MPKAGRHRSRGAVGLGLQGQSQNCYGLMDLLSYALPLLGRCLWRLALVDCPRE